MKDVPEAGREANVTPVFRKSKKEDPGHCRLVSLPSIPGKVRERLTCTPLPGGGRPRRWLGAVSVDLGR